jgi:hypothetical protein
VSEPSASEVLDSILQVFQPLLPAQIAGLPQPSLSMARAHFRPAGIGNIIGSVSTGGIGGVIRRALRVKAQIRFTLWGFVAAEVDQAVTTLTGQVFAQQPALAAKGFLKFDFDGSSPPEETRQPVAWRRFADYEVLYESSYQDSDSATGLILPIQVREQTTGTAWTLAGDAARWDDVATLDFVLRGPGMLTGLAALSFLGDPPAPPSGAVTLTRSFDGALPPANAGTLAAFLAQATAPAPERNITVSLASISDLLAAFAPNGVPTIMGDRDANGKPDPYTPGKLAFPAPLLLPHAVDRLTIAFAQPKFDRTGVLYLRGLRQGS